MADLFEQIVADYLTEKGYLTKLNVKYRKEDDKGSDSDIDVLAVHGRDHTVVVGDCKSWQYGFAGDWMLDPTRQSSERQRGYFKAVFLPEWAEGLARRVQEEFGTRKFTYTIYCTWLDGQCTQLKQRTVAGNQIDVVTLTDIICETVQRIKAKKTRSVEPTTLGRFVQLLLAAKIELDPTKP
jgi:hypothetical protein